MIIKDFENICIILVLNIISKKNVNFLLLDAITNMGQSPNFAEQLLQNPLTKAGSGRSPNFAEQLL